MLKDSPKAKLFKIVSVIVLIFCLLTIWQNHKSTKQSQIETAQNIRQTRIEKNRIKQDTPAKIQERYDVSQPNLKTAESNINKRINSGLKLAYNGGCDTPNQYNKNIKTISRLLGNNVCSSIIGQIKPKSIHGFKHQTSMAKHLIQLKLGYGAYDPNGKVLPIYLLVEYQTPAYAKYLEGGHYSKKKYKHNLYSTFELNYSPQNAQGKQLSVVHNDNGTNGHTFISKFN